MPVRFKARIRKYFPRRVESPVHFEIKWRRGDRVWKDREHVVPVLGESGDEILRRAPHFAEFVSIHRLRPSLLVADKRHAYRDPNSEARITFDQEIRFGTEPSSVCARGRLLTRAAVLEMKSKENLPPWLEAMVAQLRARRQSFSKYCLSVESDSTSGRHEAQCRFPRQHGLIDAFIRPDSPHDL